MHGRAWLSAHYYVIGMHLLLDFSSIQMHHGYVDLSSRTLLTCNCRILDYGLWVLLAQELHAMSYWLPQLLLHKCIDWEFNAAAVWWWSWCSMLPKQSGSRNVELVHTFDLLLSDCKPKRKKKRHLFFPSFLFQANMTWFQFDSEFQHQKFFSVWLT